MSKEVKSKIYQLVDSMTPFKKVSPLLTYNNLTKI